MDVEWLIHNLCFDEDFDNVQIDIDLHDDDVWARLLASLARGSAVRHLKLFRTPEYEMRTTDEIENLFTTVKMLPSLEQIELREFSVSDLEYACSALSGNRKIAKFIVDCPDKNSMSIDSMKALASIPNLRYVDIDLASIWPLSYLCDSPSVEEITVDSNLYLDFADSQISPLMNAIQTSSILRSLDVHDIRIRDDQVQLLAAMLTGNTSLEALHLSITIGDDVDRLCQFIIDAMNSNESLQDFCNYDNYTIHVGGETDKKQTQMVQRNTTLTSFSLFNDEESPEFRRKQMYLRLNKGGRKQLLKTAMGSKEAWVEALIELHDDLSCLYFVLLLSPSLCITNSYQDEGEFKRPSKRPCWRDSTT
eukprot:scaffold1727_cov133-Cylindrotheca_fusiformis.AAC.57